MFSFLFKIGGNMESMNIVSFKFQIKCISRFFLVLNQLYWFRKYHIDHYACERMRVIEILYSFCFAINVKMTSDLILWFLKISNHFSSISPYKYQTLSIVEVIRFVFWKKKHTKQICFLNLHMQYKFTLLWSFLYSENFTYISY